jgi:hypothetical protein
MGLVRASATPAAMESAAEAKTLRLRTIAPIDMTKEERLQDSKLRRRARMRSRRRSEGRKPRAQWLADNNISQTKPWEALGISRPTWYRRQRKLGSDPAVRQVCTNKDKNGEHTPVSQVGARQHAAEEGGRAGARTAPPRRTPTSKSKLRASSAAAVLQQTLALPNPCQL